MARSNLLLETQLKTLRLPTFLREYDKLARECANEALDYPRYLLRLSELELLDRQRRATEQARRGFCEPASTPPSAALSGVLRLLPSRPAKPQKKRQ